MSLNTTYGWSAGDDTRVLLAAGLPLGHYQVQQIQADMNLMGSRMPEVVSQVRDLLDAYDDAQTQINTLNQSSDGRVLIRADVLQWSAGEASSSSYGPAQEIGRVRGLLAQYFGSSPLFGMNGYADATYIVRA